MFFRTLVAWRHMIAVSTVILNGCASQLEAARSCYARHAMPIDVSLAYEELTAPGKINGHDVVVVIDTGATHSFISQKALLNFGLADHLMRSDVADNIFGNANFLKVSARFDAGNGSFGDVDLLYSDKISFPSHDPAASHQPRIVLGGDILSKYSIDLNLPDHRITLLDPDLCDLQETPFPGLGQEAKVFTNRIYLNSVVKGHDILSVIDTGADRTMIPSDIAATLGLVSHDEMFASAPIFLNTASGSEIAKGSVLDTFSFGPLVEKDFPVGVVGGQWQHRNFINIGLDILQHIRIFKMAEGNFVIMATVDNGL